MQDNGEGEGQPLSQPSSESGTNLEGRIVFGDPKEHAIAFASLVTVPSDKSDWVAKKGDESIFFVFSKVIPEVITIDQNMREVSDGREDSNTCQSQQKANR